MCYFCTPLAGPMHYTVMGAQHEAQAYMDQWGASLLPSSVFPMGCDQVSSARFLHIPLWGLLLAASCRVSPFSTPWWSGLGCPAPLGHRLQLEQGCHEQLFLFFPLCPCCSHLQNLAHAFPRQNHTGTGKMSFLQSSPSLQPQSIVEVVSSLVQWLKADLEVNLCCFF